MILSLNDKNEKSNDHSKAFISAVWKILKEFHPNGVGANFEVLKNVICEITKACIVFPLRDDLSGSMVHCCHGEVVTTEFNLQAVFRSLDIMHESLESELKKLQLFSVGKIALFAYAEVSKCWFVFKISSEDLKLACKLSIHCMKLSLEEDLLFRSLWLFRKVNIPIPVLCHMCDKISQASSLETFMSKSIVDTLIAAHLICPCSTDQHEHVVVSAPMTDIVFSDLMEFVVPVTACCTALYHTACLTDSVKNSLACAIIERLKELLQSGVTDSRTETFCKGSIDELTALICR